MGNDRQRKMAKGYLAIRQRCLIYPIKNSLFIPVPLRFKLMWLWLIICVHLLEPLLMHRTGRSSHPEVFLGKGVLKYAPNLQRNTHAEVCFQ